MTRNNRTEAVKWYATPDSFLKHRDICAARGLSQSQGIQESLRHWWDERNSKPQVIPANRPRQGPRRPVSFPGARVGRGALMRSNV